MSEVIVRASQECEESDRNVWARASGNTTALGWKAAHTAAILNQAFLVRIEHSASLDPNYGG